MTSWFYGPDGASGIFDECPEGWADHPCKLLARKSGLRKLEGDELEAAKEAISDAQASIAKFDHDGDGKPGGSKPRRKKAVKHGDGA